VCVVSVHHKHASRSCCPKGTLFDFPGQSTTLALGNDGTTFTLTTSDGTVLKGTIIYGIEPLASACRAQVYDPLL
jgi:hypothetical protein